MLDLHAKRPVKQVDIENCAPLSNTQFWKMYKGIWI